jgi:FkbM family methyltransferase
MSTFVKPCAWATFFRGELPYERGLEERLKVSLEAGSTFVDAGANVGYYTRKAVKLVGHAGRVASFEPSPRAFSLLERNVSDLPQARIYQCAVGASRLKASFGVRDKGDASSLLSYGDGRRLIIEVAPLDEILAG